MSNWCKTAGPDLRNRHNLGWSLKGAQIGQFPISFDLTSSFLLFDLDKGSAAIRDY